MKFLLLLSLYFLSVSSILSVQFLKLFPFLFYLDIQIFRENNKCSVITKFSYNKMFLENWHFVNRVC